MREKRNTNWTRERELGTIPEAENDLRRDGNQYRFRNGRTDDAAHLIVKNNYKQTREEKSANGEKACSPDAGRKMTITRREAVSSVWRQSSWSVAYCVPRGRGRRRRRRDGGGLATGGWRGRLRRIRPSSIYRPIFSRPGLKFHRTSSARGWFSPPSAPPASDHIGSSKTLPS